MELSAIILMLALAKSDFSKTFMPWALKNLTTRNIKNQKLKIPKLIGIVKNNQTRQ